VNKQRINDSNKRLSLTFVTSPFRGSGLPFLTSDIAQDYSTPRRQAATLDPT